MLIVTGIDDVPTPHMNEKLSKENRAMLDYLLGRLSDDAAEPFDELSITDSEFADALAGVENDMVDAYVGGELAGEDLKQFESYYLASPARRRKVAFAEGLQHYAERSRAAPVAEEGVSGFERFVASIRAVFATPALRFGGAFAVLAIAALGSLLYFRTSQPGTTEIVTQQNMNSIGENTSRPQTNVNTVDNSTVVRTEDPEPVANERVGPREGNSNQRRATEQRRTPPESRTLVALVLPAPLRGTGLKTLNVPPRTGIAAITLELDAAEFPRYRAVLESEGRIVWRSSAIRSMTRSGRPAITLQLPATRLSSGVNTFNVSGIAADGTAEIIGSYAFRVVR